MAHRLVGQGVSVRHIHTLVREQRHVMARFWLAGTLSSWRPPRLRRPARRPAHPEAPGVRGGPVGRRSGQRLTPPVPGPVCGVAEGPWPERRDQHRCLLQGVTCEHARWGPGMAETATAAPGRSRPPPSTPAWGAPGAAWPAGTPRPGRAWLLPWRWPAPRGFGRAERRRVRVAHVPARSSRAGASGHAGASWHRFCGGEGSGRTRQGDRLFIPCINRVVPF